MVVELGCRGDLLLDLRSNLHQWSWVLGNDRKNEIADMSFLLRVSGLTLRNRAQSLHIQKRVSVEPLFLHIEISLRWFGYLVRMPPGCFLVVGPTRKRLRGRNVTRWRNYYTLELELYLSAGLGTRKKWPGKRTYWSAATTTQSQV